jgi:hypothetical protein
MSSMFTPAQIFSSYRSRSPSLTIHLYRMRSRPKDEEHLQRYASPDLRLAGSDNQNLCRAHLHPRSRATCSRSNVSPILYRPDCRVGIRARRVPHASHPNTESVANVCAVQIFQVFLSFALVVQSFDPSSHTIALVPHASRPKIKQLPQTLRQPQIFFCGLHAHKKYKASSCFLVSSRKKVPRQTFSRYEIEKFFQAII